MRQLFYGAFIGAFFLSCAFIQPPHPESVATEQWPPTTHEEWLGYYADSLTQANGFEGVMEELGRHTVGVFGSFHFAPDSSFVIFVLEVESCGAYCNADWYSWLHQTDSSGLLVRTQVLFYNIESIETLPDGGFLVLHSNWSRPAGVLTLACFYAHAFVMEGQAMSWIPIPYKGLNHFEACEENGIDKAEAYLKWDASAQTLRYQYGNNFAYSAGIDSSVVFEGSLKYANRQFTRVFERVYFLETGTSETEE